MKGYRGKNFRNEEAEERANLIYKNITKRLLNLSGEKTQQAEAEAMGIGRTVYNKMLNGNYKFTMKMIIMLAKYYGTTIPYIIGETEKKDVGKIYNGKVTDIKDTINENVTAHLQNLSKKKSQQAEAELMGLSRTVYNKMLKGHYNFTVEKIAAIALYYNVSVSYMIEEIDKK